MADLKSAQLAGAAAALSDVLDRTEPTDAVLRAFFRARPKFGARDRAFIADTVFACLRRKRLLEHLAAGRHPRRMVLACLAKLQDVSDQDFAPLVGPAEAVWLGKVRATSIDDLPLPIRCDLPDWLIERLVLQLGSEDALLALACSLHYPAPLDLRVNTMKAARHDVLVALARDGITASPTPFSPLGVRVQGNPPITRHALFRSGVLEVQDEGSQLLGLLAAPRRHDLVVDFCAGAGGKTLLLGALMQSQGRLYAFDTSEKRLSNLKPRLGRAGLTSVQPQLVAGEHDPNVQRLRGKVDRVLVDAPCSGLGTLRRSPDLKWRVTPESIDKMKAAQASILDAAGSLVRPGGRLVYGTCSLLAEENDEIVDAFLAKHRDFNVRPAAHVLAKARIPLDTGCYLRLTPQAHGCDGFFAAVLDRKVS